MEIVVYILVFYFYNPTPQQIISAHRTAVECEDARKAEVRPFGFPICQVLVIK